MKVSRWTLLWLVIVGLLVAIELAILFGVVNPYDVVTFFFIMVAALVVIAVLAVIGAAFLGIYISHRILSTRDFTPFEQEMLRMADEVRKLSEKVDAISRELKNEDPPKR
ncbi:MAG: hypothetical protein A3K65_04130 [Euryarchaeota archaeon RBG_16_68_12]|nr:MAG: hypothetical protein A3K65_04130 [Euryarchaeota archaeon RBG_16_68_12]